MHRNLLFILLFPVLAFSQHIPVGTISTSTRTWFTTLGTTPAPLTLYAVNNFVDEETGNADWTRVITYYLFGQDNATNALTGLKAPGTYTAVAVNSPTFVADSGYRFNGTSQYINSEILSSNITGFGVYSLTNIDNSGVSAGVELTAGGRYTIIYPRHGGLFYSATNLAVADYVASAYSNSDSRSFFFCYKPTGTTFSSYIRSTQVYTATVANVGGIPSNIFIGAYNFNGTPQTYDNRNLSFFVCINGTGSFTESTLYADIQQLGTALGWAK